MGATCAHSSMAQYCSGFTVGRVGDLGARLGSESRGKGRSAHWTVRSPKSAPYTRRKQFVHLEPALARPSCNASGKRLRSQRCGSNSMRLAALLQLLATTFHDSAAERDLLGLFCAALFLRLPARPLWCGSAELLCCGSSRPQLRHREGGQQRWTMKCGGSMRGVCQVAMPISPTLPANLFCFLTLPCGHDSRFRAFSQHVQRGQEMP